MLINEPCSLSCVFPAVLLSAGGWAGPDLRTLAESALGSGWRDERGMEAAFPGPEEFSLQHCQHATEQPLCLLQAPGWGPTPSVLMTGTHPSCRKDWFCWLEMSYVESRFMQREDSSGSCLSTDILRLSRLLPATVMSNFWGLPPTEGRCRDGMGVVRCGGVGLVQHV